MFNPDRPYNSVRWRKVRAKQLHKQPLCALCAQAGRVTMADTVDHITPHKGNQRLAWAEDNLQSLCPTCHESVKKLYEIHGVMPGCDINGFPLDPNHRWSKE